jgi:hypothetical protein
MCADYTAYNYVGEIAALIRRIRAVGKVNLLLSTRRRHTERDVASQVFDLMEVTSQFHVPAVLYQGKDLAVDVRQGAGVDFPVGLDAMDRESRRF